MFPQYQEREQQLEAWAERKCSQMDDSLDAFCGAAEALGIVHHEQTLFQQIVISLVAPDVDAWKSCLSGESLGACGWAMTDLPWGRVFKGLKVLKVDPPCNSFASGTEVLMADGSRKPIEDVKVGDEVVATDPETGKTEIETVTAEITGEGPKNLVTLSISVGGEEVRVTATDGHPFWVPGLEEWVDAGRLTAGQELHTVSGKTLRISSISLTQRPATVHNLTVTDLHTYYVLAGQTPVLVHNATPGQKCDLTLGAGPNAREGVGLENGDIEADGVRDLVNESGNKYGCHTCDATTPGTKDGDWIPDHQPPSSLVAPGSPQTAYPHCVPCARRQGGVVSQLSQEKSKKEW
ncbi:hypothetical protein GCM10018771_15820 [Streptomyces cellulosae]|nr:hypothetical protein GCM10018771_15820 [Streptomyces cellulosae]